MLCGFIITLSWAWAFDLMRKENLHLFPSSESYRLWVKTPMPLFMELYLFNWSNADTFLVDETVKPSFTQVGPFVFKEVHEKVAVLWNDNETVTYNQTRSWYLVPEKSVNLSFPITNINVALTAIAKAASTHNIFVQGLLDFLINKYKEKLIVTRPAEEWLFKGMNDKLLDFLRKHKPTSVPFDRFGWFYARNQSSSYDGRFNVQTGRNNIYNMGLVNTWNNDHRTEYFEGECGIIRGTTSEIFPPLQSNQDSLTIFLSDFCGTFTLHKSGPVKVRGLDGYRFFGGDQVFDNGTKYSESECFCTGNCSPSGVRNESLCRKAPVFISFPHFYLADSTYVNAVEGLKPNKSKHEFYITIHELTGLPLEVCAQLQINVLLEPIPLVPIFSKVPKIYVPMMWFRQRIELTDELISLGMKAQFFNLMGYALGCVLLFLGLLIIAINAVKLRYFNNQRDESLIISNEEKEDAEDTD
ncbi:hypothetical protein RUM44_011830 [Polyplax serrata]|uniref:Protein croquemort n=1 Tax=Polyplax serrata TaxID=468196 RepID=A0ABR1BBI2_POLSC